jgi:hypothetical protein
MMIIVCACYLWQLESTSSRHSLKERFEKVTKILSETEQNNEPVKFVRTNYYRTRLLTIVTSLFYVLSLSLSLSTIYMHINNKFKAVLVLFFRR